LRTKTQTQPNPNSIKPKPGPKTQLKAAGLSALNISLDTLRPDRFEAMTRRGGHARVLAAIEEALRLGYDPVKVRGPAPRSFHPLPFLSPMRPSLLSGCLFLASCCAAGLASGRPCAWHVLPRPSVDRL
jgi:hypothetical protein